MKDSPGQESQRKAPPAATGICQPTERTGKQRPSHALMGNDAQVGGGGAEPLSHRCRQSGNYKRRQQKNTGVRDRKSQEKNSKIKQETENIKPIFLFFYAAIYGSLSSDLIRSGKFQKTVLFFFL